MSENLAVLTDQRNDFSGMIGRNYVTLDPTVRSPKGNPTIRIDPDLVEDDQMRELEPSTGWRSVKPGDKIVWRCMAKTSEAPMPYPWDGVRLGFDLHVYDTDNKAHIVDGSPWDYENVGGQYRTNGGAKNLLPHFPISQFTVPWNRDWTLIQLEFTIPDGIYSIDEVTKEALSTPQKINMMVPWVDAREFTEGTAWVGDFEWYINPSSLPPPEPQIPTYRLSFNVIDQEGNQLTSLVHVVGGNYDLAANSPYYFDLIAGNYTVSTTYNGQNFSQSVNLDQDRNITFTVAEEEPPPPPIQQGSQMWIATALSYSKEDIELLRKSGHALLPQNIIDLYHSNGEDMAEFVKAHPEIRDFLKRLIDRLLFLLKN